MTASTSSRSSASARSVELWRAPYFAATAPAWSAVRLMIETISTPSIRCSPSRCFSPNAPGSGEGDPHRQLLQYHVPDRGVRRRDAVEAVSLDDVGTERAAHDQPHDQFDPLRPRLAQIVEVRQRPQAVGVGGQVVEEGGVEGAVDQSGARPLQLVAHAAGPPDLDIEVVGEGSDGAGDRLAQPPAAVAGRRRILDDVDRERYDLARPLRPAARTSG